jgi:two-component system response regulator RegX3
LAKDGVECIEKFEREKPDLVICDVRMPKMTGLDVYSEINDRANVIVISGVVSERQIPEEIVERGDFVAKPLSPKDFIEKIKERLNG